MSMQLPRLHSIKGILNQIMNKYNNTISALEGCPARDAAETFEDGSMRLKYSEYIKGPDGNPLDNLITTQELIQLCENFTSYYDFSQLKKEMEIIPHGPFMGGFGLDQSTRQFLTELVKDITNVTVTHQMQNGVSSGPQFSNSDATQNTSTPFSTEPFKVEVDLAYPIKGLFEQIKKSIAQLSDPLLMILAGSFYLYALAVPPSDPPAKRLSLFLVSLACAGILTTKGWKLNIEIIVGSIIALITTGLHAWHIGSEEVMKNEVRAMNHDLAVREYKERINFPVEPQAINEDEVSDIGATFLATIVSACCWTEHKTTSDFISKTLRSLGPLKTITKAMLAVSSIVSEFVTKNVLKKQWMPTTGVKIFDSWIKEVQQLLRQSEDGDLIPNDTNFDRVRVLIESGTELLKDIPGTRHYQGIKIVFLQMLQELKAARVSLSSSSYKYKGVRQEPVGILLRGRPGVGKSMCMQFIANAVLGMTLETKQEIEEYKKNAAQFTFNRQSETIYWDGYDSRKYVTFYDDILQIRDVAGVSDNEAMSIIRNINIFENLLHCARIDLKQNTLFRSRFVIATTNAENFKFESINESQAFLRRWSVAVKVTLKREFTKERDDPDWSIDNHTLDAYALPKDEEGYSIFVPECCTFSIEKLDSSCTKFVSAGHQMEFMELVRHIVSVYRDKQRMHQNYLKCLEKTLDFFAAENENFHDAVEEQPEVVPQAGASLPNPQNGIQMNSVEESSDEFPAYVDDSWRYTDNPADLTFALSYGDYEAIMKTASSRLGKGYRFNPDELCLKTGYVEYTFEANTFKCVLEDVCAILCRQWSYKPTDVAEVILSVVYDIEKGFSDNITGLFDTWDTALYPARVTAFSGVVRGLLESRSDEVGWLTQILERWDDKLALWLKQYREKHGSWSETATTQTYEFIIGCNGVAENLLRTLRKTGNDMQISANPVKRFLGLLVFNLPYVATAGAVATGLITLVCFMTGTKDHAEAQSNYQHDKLAKAKIVRTLKAQPPKQGVNVVPQGMSTYNKNLPPVMQSCVSRNLFSAYAKSMKKGKENELELYCHVLGMKGRFFLIPQHVVAMWQIGGTDLVHLRKIGSTVDDRVFTLSSLTFFNSKVCEDSDLLLVQMPVSCQPFRDITNFVITQSEVDRRGLVNSVIAVPNISEKCSVSYYHCDAKLNFNVDVGGEKWVNYKVAETWQYNIPCKPGDCGSLLFLDDPRLKRCIAGFHVAGSEENRVGFASVITIESLNKMFEPFLDSGVLDITGDEIESLVEKGQEVISGEADNMDHLTILPQGLFPTSPQKSSLRTTPFYRKIDSPKKDRARLRPFVSKDEDGNPVTIDPMKIAQQLYCKEPIVVPEDKLSVVCSSLYNYLQLNSDYKVSAEVYDFETAVVGMPWQDSFFKGIPRGTAAGYPYNTMPGEKSKHRFFGYEQDFDLTNQDSLALKSRCLDIILRAQDLVRSCHIFTDQLKDERRSFEKVKKGLTRMFSGAPVELLIVSRMYFGAFQRWIAANHIKNGIAIGINERSPEWNVLAQFLLSKTHRDPEAQCYGAGDFKGFDMSERASILWNIYHLIEKWYYMRSSDFEQYTREKNVRFTLWHDLVFSRHVVGNLVKEWKSSLPSGHPLTAVVNCLYNHMVFRLCFVDICDSYKIPLTAFDFESVIYLCVMGDDNVYSVDQNYSHIFTELEFSKYMLRYGMIYTPEEKEKGSHGLTLRRLREVSFLKRNFRYEPVLGLYVGPREIDSIVDSTYWTRSYIMSDIQENLHAAIAELALHDEKVFNSYLEKYERAIITDECRMYNLGCTDRNSLLRLLLSEEGFRVSSPDSAEEA